MSRDTPQKTERGRYVKITEKHLFIAVQPPPPLPKTRSGIGLRGLRGLNFKTAFTLAEVLITLTIIGVIAAITIPNLMQTWKKHEVEVRLKEAYSILSNALKMAQVETDLMDNMNLLPYLKYDDMCVGHDDSNIFPQYKNCRTNSKLFQKEYCSGSTCMGLYGWWYYAFALKNGMILYISTGADSTRNKRGYLSIYIDINGDKGPNKHGIDLFRFTYLVPQTGLGSVSQRGTIVPGNNGHYNWPCWGKINCITCKSDENYAGCSALIMRNGWKIPDDYPLKKF